VPGGAGEADQVGSGGRGQLPAGRPALQQPQHGGGGQVTRGDLQRGREGRDEIGSQPVGEAALVSGGALVVAGDGAQLPASSPWGTSGRSAAWRSRASRQAMRASSVSSFLRAGPRQRATRSGLTGSTVEPASSSRSTSSPWRVSRLPGPRPGQAPGWRCGSPAPPRRRGVLDPQDLHHPLVGSPRATRWNSSAQSMPTASTTPPLLDADPDEGARRADGPVLKGTTPLWASGLQGRSPGTPSHISPHGQAAKAFPRATP
jgi:hypothetical protein